MSPRRHPSDAVLVDYASGALRQAFAVVVAAHLEACATCRGSVALLEHLAGELLSEAEPEPLAPESLERTLARLDDAAHAGAREDGAFAGRLRLGRRRWMGLGLWVRKAAVPGSDLLYIVRLPPGVRTAPHAHGGLEFTMVLRGAFHDGTKVLEQGDFDEHRCDGPAHAPRVETGGDCVCLVASERPMRFSGWLNRMAATAAGV